jgi:predicted amidohydrolase
MQDVKIGLVNMESVVGDTDANLLSMAAWAGKAAAEGVEILW